MRAADLLVQTLQQMGVRHLFSLSGNQIMSVYDACVDSTIRILHVRHEAAAVHMADAWGRLTGTPGVALLTAGPGHANAVSALYVALMAESPVVAISGHAPLSQLGGAFQELDQIGIIAPVTKSSWRVDKPERIADELRRAFRVAKSLRPGPVHLSLPEDVLEAEIPVPAPSAADAEPEYPILRQETLRYFADALSASERPLILAGPAVMRSTAFAKAAPVCAAWGVPLIGMESPRGLMDPALGAVAPALSESDLVLLIGKKLDFTLRRGRAGVFDPRAVLLQVDWERSVLELTRRHTTSDTHIGQLVQSDPAQTLLSVVQALKTTPRARSEWHEKVRGAVSYRLAPPCDATTEDGRALHPVTVGQAIDRFLGLRQGSVLVSDGGEFGQWIQACVSVPWRVINGPSGAIGGAVPFALAARLARPAARIVACSGDGAFGYHASELETAVRYGLPFIVVVGNDACWNAEYQIQLRRYGQDRARGCRLLPAAYHEVAVAFGGWGRGVNTADELVAALAAAEASGLPACINVTIKSEPAPVI